MSSIMGQVVTIDMVHDTETLGIDLTEIGHNAV